MPVHRRATKPESSVAARRANSDPRAECRAHRLTEAFRRIGTERMRDLPMFNPVLEVEAVGFQEIDGRPTGVLITPWFMNLTVLAGEGDDWVGLADGVALQWIFPAGRYELRVSHVNGVGALLSCPLFTSMLDFPQQDLARRIACQVMKALLCQRGGGVAGSKAECESAGPVASRRAFLRRFLPDGRP